MKWARNGSLVAAVALAAVGCGQVRLSSNGSAGSLGNEAAGSGAIGSGTAGRALNDLPRPTPAPTPTPPPMPKPPWNPVAGTGGPVTCPAIACVGGARLSLDFPYSFADARNATFEACRNDLCYKSNLDARVTEPEPGSGVGFRAPPAGTASNDDFVEVFLTNEDGRGLSLQFWWWPNDSRTLRDGDRYKLVMTAGGVRTVFLDELAKYSDSSLGAPGTPCYQHCALFQDDRRGKGLPHQGGEDAGI